ncbi:MAG: hypothetical protein HYT03_02350 [Candidatus Harrisonbacteria bacterium]|nr:hypothetical protein [Candidatus Harrisonbacteria bacterium]
MNIRYISILAFVAFLLHIIWENAQAPFYAGYQSFLQHLPICSIGVFGDILITLLVLAFLWLLKKNLPSTKTDFFALAIIGFVIAVAIEQNALLLGKWSYAPTMPLIPYLQVGLMPILQMTILLPLSFYITGLFNKKV